MESRVDYSKRKLKECREDLANEEKKLEKWRQLIEDHDNGKQVMRGKLLSAKQNEHNAVHKVIPELKKRIAEYEKFLTKKGHPIHHHK